MTNAAFNWLHLSDLHFGLGGQTSLWPNVRDSFFGDLADLRERAGPWDAVLFTGDFVQRGGRDEFQRLDKEVLEPLWQKLTELGSGHAVLLAVPGNHDLVRPAIGRKPTLAEKILLKPEPSDEVAEDVCLGPHPRRRDGYETAVP
jgi:3',5'-cyclic AMP phosphodiesterase CpdA